MKKILVAIACTLCVCSCGFNENPDGGMTKTNRPMLELELVDVEFNGERHEYVYFHCASGRSLAHWEGCKYCKHCE